MPSIAAAVCTVLQSALHLYAYVFIAARMRTLGIHRTRYLSIGFAAASVLLTLGTAFWVRDEAYVTIWGGATVLYFAVLWALEKVWFRGSERL